MTVSTITPAPSGAAPDPAPKPAPMAIEAIPNPDPFDDAPLAIASERCKGCELCLTACPHHVLALDEHVVNRLGYHPVRLIDPAGCTSCVICARVCPDAVFTVYAPRKAARA